MPGSVRANGDRRPVNLIGIETIYEEADGATGFLLVIDRRNHEVVERLTRDDNEEAIEAKLCEALAG